MLAPTLRSVDRTRTIAKYNWLTPGPLHLTATTLAHTFAAHLSDRLSRTSGVVDAFAKIFNARVPDAGGSIGHGLVWQRVIKRQISGMSHQTFAA